MTDDPVVMVQSQRGGQWHDYGANRLSVARRHIEQNTPGVWRAINVAGQVVVPPREHVHSAMAGSVVNGTGTCRCGLWVSRVEDGWRAHWPPRRSGDAPPVDWRQVHQPSVNDDDQLVCSCGWSSYGMSEDDPPHEQFERHLTRVGVGN